MAATKKHSSSQPDPSIELVKLNGEMELLKCKLTNFLRTASILGSIIVAAAAFFGYRTYNDVQGRISEIGQHQRQAKETSKRIDGLLKDADQLSTLMYGTRQLLREHLLLDFHALLNEMIDGGPTHLIKQRISDLSRQAEALRDSEHMDQAIEFIAMALPHVQVLSREGGTQEEALQALEAWTHALKPIGRESRRLHLRIESYRQFALGNIHRRMRDSENAARCYRQSITHIEARGREHFFSGDYAFSRPYIALAILMYDKFMELSKGTDSTHIALRALDSGEELLREALIHQQSGITRGTVFNNLAFFGLIRAEYLAITCGDHQTAESCINDARDIIERAKSQGSIHPILYATEAEVECLSAAIESRFKGVTDESRAIDVLRTCSRLVREAISGGFGGYGDPALGIDFLIDRVLCANSPLRHLLTLRPNDSEWSSKVRRSLREAIGNISVLNRIE